MATQNPKITIASLEEIIEREMTDEEVAELKATRTDIQTRIENELAEKTAKETAKQSLLDKLGITQEEAKLLLS